MVGIFINVPKFNFESFRKKWLLKYSGFGSYFSQDYEEIFGLDKDATVYYYMQ